MQLDVATLRVTGAAIGLMMGLLSLLLWLTGRMYPGFGRWTLAKFVAAPSIFLSSALPGWPDWLTLIPAAFLGLFSVTLSLEACREFLGSRPVNKWAYGFIAAVLVSIAFFILALGMPTALGIQTSWSIACIYGATAFTLFRAKPPGSRVGRISTGIVFSIWAAGYATNGLVLLLAPAFPGRLVAFYLTTQTLGIILNVCFFLMHYERLLHDEEEQLASATSANLALADLRSHLEDTIRVKTAELMQAQRLETVGRLSAGLAHDFNNVLTVARGHAQRLLGKLPGVSPFRSHVEQIVKATEDGALLTRNLLAFGGQQDLHPRPFEMNDELQKLETTLNGVLNTNIELVLSLCASPAMVMADPDQIRRVMLNLVLNARDAMPSGGVLTIASAVDHREVVVSVADTGSGMDAETRERIFEPFFSTKSKAEGSGLGLAAIYGIVKQSQGSIQVESEVGKGSTFRIFLPRTTLWPEAPPQQFGSKSTAGDTTILVVEDFQEVRELIVTILEDAGYATVTAATGEEGLAVLRQYQGALDLVMTDLSMPGMSGRRFAQHIWEDWPQTRIVFMSGYADHVLDASGSRAEMLRKPFTDEDLVLMVRKALQSA